MVVGHLSLYNHYGWHLVVHSCVKSIDYNFLTIGHKYTHFGVLNGAQIEIVTMI